MLTLDKGAATMHPQLAIKVNCTVYDPAPCALCGEWIEVQPGPGIYPLDAWEPVCEDCGAVHAPELQRVLRTALPLIEGV